MSNTVKGRNPITCGDFPDPDVIRVGDTYYMCSTTMYFMPGGAMLRSYDLINWELCSHIYDTLEDTPRQNLDGTDNAYANGMWAPCLRYHNGIYHVFFIANDTRKTYHFTAESPEGPWKKDYVEGFYHDCSVLFDDDGRVYIIYGNRELHITELKADLSGPVPGTDRVVIKDEPGPFLGYEGAHLYKINGKYYVFLIHSARDEWIRVEACFMADSIYGPWTGGDVIRYRLPDTTGVAQGGIVDTPDGRWYGVIFGDRGAVGRIPNLVPMTFDKTGFPVFETPSEEIESSSTRPGYSYSPLFKSDSFDSSSDESGRLSLDPVWEFNHNPKLKYVKVSDGRLILTTEKLSPTVEYARNTLTQRTKYPNTCCTATVDGSMLNNGDIAGICMLQCKYGLIGIAKECDRLYIVMRAQTERHTGSPHSVMMDKEYARVPLNGSSAVLRAVGSFSLGSSREEFYYLDGGEFKPLGIAVEPEFDLRHFVGVRVGLFNYSRNQTGGSAAFSNFIYE